MLKIEQQVEDIDIFVKKALKWASAFETACCYHSQGYRDNYCRQFDVLIAADAHAEYVSPENDLIFEGLQGFIDKYPDSWLPGWLTYDLKNVIESLTSEHPQSIDLPNAYFFLPRYLIIIRGNSVECFSNDPKSLYDHIVGTSLDNSPFKFEGALKPTMHKDEYYAAFNRLLAHIFQGNIYEVNLCQEFIGQRVEIDPVKAFWRLSELSPTPFSAFFKKNDKYIISASPERFLTKFGNKLISQPIKGTISRGSNIKKDEQNKRLLFSDPKEIAENVMIVDLVRNDLTKNALPGTVKVEELRGIYTYKHVHQAISTISCILEPTLSLTESIKNMFPAGSMTGAPKINAMKLIDEVEPTRRGLYAGSLGYFGPDSNYDFNVFIRSFIYCATAKTLSFHVGSAITAQSNPEYEYQECLWKAEALFELLQTNVEN